MGILNVTPDSFSDAGKFFNPETARDQALKMIDDGADIIDIGGESTRPYAKPVGLDEELRRVVPAIKWVRKKSKVLISIDTYKSEVARACMEEGADIINDISALRMDLCMGKVAAKYKVPVVLMHMLGEPGTMQADPKYRDVISEISLFFKKQIKKAADHGIERSKIIIDPGIGFGKTTEHNLKIINKLENFKKLGCPVLIGPSRKSFIGKITDTDVRDRMEGTAAAVAVCVMNGADILRVHDVKEMRRVMQVAYAIKTVTR